MARTLVDRIILQNAQWVYLRARLTANMFFSLLWHWSCMSDKASPGSRSCNVWGLPKTVWGPPPTSCGRTSPACQTFKAQLWDLKLCRFINRHFKWRSWHVLSRPPRLPWIANVFWRVVFQVTPPSHLKFVGLRQSSFILTHLGCVKVCTIDVLKWTPRLRTFHGFEWVLSETIHSSRTCPFCLL